MLLLTQEQDWFTAASKILSAKITSAERSLISWNLALMFSSANMFLTIAWIEDDGSNVCY